MTFKKGESGNPAGRPPGTTLAGRLRDVVGEEFDAIMGSIIKAAKEGDMQAASLLLSRTCPPMKAVQQTAPVPISGDTLSEKAGAILDLVARGELAVGDAKDLLGALGNVARITETDELLRRIEALERQQRGPTT